MALLLAKVAGPFTIWERIMPIRNVMPDAKTPMEIMIRDRWLADLEKTFAERRAKAEADHEAQRRNPLLKSERDWKDEDRLRFLKGFVSSYHPRGKKSIQREIEEIETRLERHRQWRQLKAARLQVKQLKRYLKGHPEALQSLPPELGPAASLRK